MLAGRGGGQEWVWFEAANIRVSLLPLQVVLGVPMVHSFSLDQPLSRPYGQLIPHCLDLGGWMEFVAVGAAVWREGACVLMVVVVVVLPW